MTAENEPRSKRLSMSEILELALTRRRSSSITLSRSPSGETTIDVQVATGDGADTVEEAEAKASAIYGRLVALFPSSPSTDSGSLTLSRNAKGDTQLEVTVRAGAQLTSVDEAAAKAVELYDQARGRYPLADGTTAAPGTVNDKRKVGRDG